MTVWEGLLESPAVASIAAVLERGASPPAWLLSGPSGSGKRAIASAMAAALECVDLPGQGCGRCRACRRVQRGTFPDVHVIEPEGMFIRVETIREEVIPEASRSPYEGPWKVFIVAEAERMNPSSQNALLKTLEEPPGDSVFILLSEQEEELLETVRSRCRSVRLPPLAPERVEQALLARGASREQATLAVAVAGGDMERAHRLSMEEDVAARRQMWLDIVHQLGDPARALAAAATVVEEAGKAVKAKEKEQRKEQVELAETTGEGRGTAAARTALVNRHKRQLRRLESEILMEALDSIAGFLRDVVVVRSGDGAVSNPDRMEDLRRWASSETSSASLLALSQRCLAACADLEKNANPLLTLEAVFSSASKGR